MEGQEYQTDYPVSRRYRDLKLLLNYNSPITLYNLSQTSQKLPPYITPDALLPHAASDVKVMH
jgi:hypothetical protein